MNQMTPEMSAGPAPRPAVPGVAFSRSRQASSRRRVPGFQKIWRVGVLHGLAALAALGIASPAARAGTDAWTGAVNSNWDISTANWFLSQTTAAGDFANGDTATFGDTGVSSFAVNVNANVAPASMVFSNSTHNYTVGSSGGYSIGGSGGLTLAGTGSVTFSNNNTFTGTILIGSGATLALAGAGQIGNGIYAAKMTNNGALAYNSSASQTITGVISGPGGISVNGPPGLIQWPSGIVGSNLPTGNVLLLGAANSFTGNITITNGAVINTNVESSGAPTVGGLGNPQTAGRTVSIGNGGALILDAPGGNEFGYGSATPKLAFVVGPGGLMEIQSGNATVGQITLNGGELLLYPSTTWQYAAFELDSDIVVGGTTNSLITNLYEGAGGGMNLGVGSGAARQFTFNVSSTGFSPDLTVASVLSDTGSVAYGSGSNGFILTGGGTMALTDTNIYHGPTTLSNGVLVLGSVETAGLSGPLGRSSASNPGNINFYGGALRYSPVNHFDYSGRFATNSGQSFKIDVDGQTVVFASPLVSSSGTLSLMDSVGGGSLALSSAAALTGPTTVSKATLYLTGTGTVSNSLSLTITNGGVLDASAATGGMFTMGPSQNLVASNLPNAYAVNGTLVTGSNTAIYPAGDGQSGTLTFNQGLALTAGSTLNFDVSSAYNGANDQIAVNGALTLNGNLFHLKAANSSAPLDTSGNDYVLVTAAGGVSGSFNPTPYFDVAPANPGSYTIVTLPHSVVLRYSGSGAASAPTVTNLAASNIGYTNATLNGLLISAGNPLPIVTLYYGTNDGGANPAAWKSGVLLGLQAGSFGASLSNLVPNTTYYYAALASNASGAIWAQPSQSFTTLTAFPAAVTNLPATSVQGNSAIFAGQVLSVGTQTPAVSLYYGPADGQTNPAAWSNNIYLGPQTSNFSVTVLGLVTNTAYYYAAAATNLGGYAWAQPSLSFTTLPSAPVVSVLTYHNDLPRTGANTNETLLTPANVNTNTFGRLMNYPVDGYIFAQPLYVPNVAIPGQGMHNVVYVATENDTVYAFDADTDTGANGGVLWSNNMGVAPLANTGEFGTRYGTYGNLTPEIGITGTPVIDPVAGLLYVDALTRTATGSSTNYYHSIHAINITNGLDQSYSPVVVSASVPGTGIGGNGSVVTFNPRQHLQRPALTLAGGIVYVGYGSFGDTDPYHGWVFGFSATNLQQLANYNFCTTPNATTAVFGSHAGEGAFWMGGGGFGVDTNTNLFMGVGNGSFSANTNGGDYGDSFLKLSTSNGLAVADYFTPSNQASMQTYDTDLGSGGPVLLPDSAGSAAHPHLLASGDKAGVLFLVDRDNMGTFTSASSANRDVEEISTGFNIFSTPTYFNNTLYVQGQSGPINAFIITNGYIFPTPASTSPTSFAGIGVTSSLSANGTNNAIVWAIQTDGANVSDTTPGVLHAYNATNLSQELYNTSQLAARDNPGAGVKYTVPTVANGKVYVGAQYVLSVYGLTSFLATPTISPNGAAYTNSVLVTLSDATPGAAIYYTLDGSQPTTNSILYTNPFYVSATLNLRAIAVKTGAANSGVASASFINTAALGDGSGLLGEYWTNASAAAFTNPAFATLPTLTRTDAVINFNWSAAGPAASIGQTNFTARWIGCVQPQYTETYTLTAISHSGVRLWVNGQLLINAWTDQTAPITNSAAVAFTAQQLYNLQLDYFQSTGAAAIQLLWSGPSTAQAVIPQTQLYPYTNPPPAVLLVAPTNGATYSGSASVTFTADADAQYNPLTNLVFYTNGVAAASLASSPCAPYYTLTLTGLSPGSYALIAAAKDGSGLAATSAPVNITVNPGSGLPYGLAANASLGAFLNSNMPPAFNGPLPALLSQTGAYSDTPNRVPSPGLIPYIPNTPLWSDSAQKSRYLGLPITARPVLPAQQIAYAPAGQWSFPSGTVFVKNFDLVVNQTNPAAPLLRLETRLLVRDTNGAVYGVTYKWRPDNSDADLLTASQTEAISITNSAGVFTQNWYFPSPSDCLQCHTGVAGYVLGVNTRQLNNTNAYPATGVTDNQLRVLNHLGAFNPAFDDAGISSLEQLSSVTNPNAPLVQRARSYLDANCAQCHQPGGTGITFDARYDTPLQNQKLTNYPASFSLGVDNAQIIAPNDIWRSVIYARMSSLNPAIKMPPLARNLIDTNALATFNAWIDSLGGPPTLAPPAVSPTPGIYTNQVVLTVQPPDANSTLYYTLDGSLPTTNSPPYLAPLTLDYAATFTVNAFEANYVNSIAVGGSYTIVPPLNSFFAPSLLANGSFEMQYWANPNQTYILQSSTDLVNWISVSTNTPAAAPFQWLDSPTNAAPYRFYRVISP